MSIALNLSSKQLHRAATLRERIEALEKELTGVLGVPAEPTVAPAPGAKRPKRRFSAGDPCQDGGGPASPLGGAKGRCLG
jgi:hypothetical protein